MSSIAHLKGVLSHMKRKRRIYCMGKIFETQEKKRKSERFYRHRKPASINVQFGGDIFLFISFFYLHTFLWKIQNILWTRLIWRHVISCSSNAVMWLGRCASDILTYTKLHLVDCLHAEKFVDTRCRTICSKYSQYISVYQNSIDLVNSITQSMYDFLNINYIWIT